MPTNNPFDLILSKLDQLQTIVNGLAENAQKNNSPAIPSPERLLDLTEAAQVVRRPVGTVRYYIHSRGLPATKIGKGYLVKMGELLAWVEEFNKTGEKGGPVDRMRENRKRHKKN
jgi:excisionase family DNA binding protein